MGPPRVLFLRTDDGFDIAYTVMGEGPPLVLMPTPFGHLDNDWHWWKRSLLEELSRRFRVIHYNSRGHGMSSRGLPDDFEIEHYVRDLDAVVERTDPGRYVLWGFPLFGYVGMLHALKRPERVSALILHNCGAGRPWQSAENWAQLASESWEQFLYTFGAVNNVLPNRDTTDAERGLNQHDFLTIVRASSLSPTFLELASGLTVPTLVVVSADVPGAIDAGRELVGVLQRGTLVSVPSMGRDLYSEGTEPPAIVTIVEEFLASLDEQKGPPMHAPAAGEAAGHPGLTRREREVLRLVADGKTNREIADALVISERTVINHLSNIFAKTGVENRAGAAAFAVRHGIA